SAISITENSFTILKMIEVLERIDLPPSEMAHCTMCLERADPDEVVEAITDLMGLGEVAAQGQVQESLTPVSYRQNTRRMLGSLPQEREIKPKIRAIPKSNRILVVGRQQDIQYIQTLVSYFDEPVARKKMVRRKLNYVPVATILPIAHHALLRSQSGEDAVETAGGEVSEQAEVSTGSVGGTNSSSEEVKDLGPQSLIVGKTLLIADNIQNTLLMSGAAEDIETLNELVDSMDIKPRQILISAIIAQLTLGKDFTYGLDFLRTLGDSNGAGVFRSRSGTLLDTNSLTDFNNFLPAANGLTVYGQVNPVLDSFLSTIENHNRFKVLSRPMVYTLNNRRAEILSGQRIAVPRTQQSVLSPNQVNTNQVVTSSIDFEEVLLRIEVIPLINEEDRITLQIAQTNEDIVGNQVIGGDQIPTIGTQALKTTVICENGGTILIGGLISEEDSKSKTGAPIMVNIPLVGDIFGNSQVDKERQELMIFIQPRIVDSQCDLTRTEADLYERTKFLDETMEFAKPEYEARARPVKSPKKRTLLDRFLNLDKVD
ncbi:MAG: hypothetical protein P1V20_13220, partial [Verrucomicrobiales bacterium]|nr:hypothetical protein [Verrucomicrobiales bacterium]